MSAPLDVLADVVAAIESEGIVERFPVSADVVREVRAAVAELIEALDDHARSVTACCDAVGSRNDEALELAGGWTCAAQKRIEDTLARCKGAQA